MMASVSDVTNFATGILESCCSFKRRTLECSRLLIFLTKVNKSSLIDKLLIEKEA